MFDLVGEFIDTPGNGGHEAGFVAGGVEHFPDQEAGGGFAIGAGNADDAEFAGGSAGAEGGEAGAEEMVG